LGMPPEPFRGVTLPHGAVSPGELAVSLDADAFAGLPLRMRLGLVAGVILTVPVSR
jgi:hypothetical protein